MPRLKIKTLSFDSQPSLFDSLEMDYHITVPRRIRFISFGSGSSGNCAYIGNDDEGFLIDAGVSPDKVVPELRRRGISMAQVKGICITHDHADHVRYVYKLLKKYPHMGFYATPKALSGIFRRHSLSPRLKDYHRPFYIETPFRIGAFTVTAFTVSHDGTDNVGFFITLDGRNFAVATDLGSITDRVDFYMRQAHYIMIEANYDETMLRTGRYPEYLKARVAAGNGHMDNAATADFLSRIWTENLRYVFLCHLSHDNNTPETALSAVRSALTARGVTVGDASGSIESRAAALQLYALPRFDPSPFFTLL